MKVLIIIHTIIAHLKHYTSLSFLQLKSLTEKWSYFLLIYLFFNVVLEWFYLVWGIELNESSYKYGESVKESSPKD